MISAAVCSATSKQTTKLAENMCLSPSILTLQFSAMIRQNA